MKIALLTIGSELLNGMRADTNAQWIGKEVILYNGNIQICVLEELTIHPEILSSILSNNIIWR